MKEVTVSELKQMKDNGESYQLIDVREEHEYEAANINGELIPMGTLLDNVDNIRRDVPVIIHCRSGGRSSAIIQQLEKEHGFDNLYNLKGGIRAYAAEIDPDIHVS